MPSRHSPLAIVTPWWSEPCFGGAEFLAHEIALQLLSRGYPVEVLTTCGRDAFSDWAQDFHPPGTVSQGGLTVRRFPLSSRNGALFARHSETLSEGKFLTPAAEKEFLANSINSHDLCAFIEENRDRYGFCFLPFLYGTTYYGVQASAGRAVIIPCLHNEPIAYLAPFQKMMGAARGLWFLSEAEYFFARSLYPIHDAVARVVGAGMDFCGRGDGGRFRSKHGLDGPYVLSAGRRVPGKGFGLLNRCFGSFVERHRQWRLVLAGPGHDGLHREPPPGALDLGHAEKQELWDAMAGATVFCQPSHYESFSYVLMEAWSQGTPALVNANCEVLRQQCATSGGGLWFADKSEFENALLYLEGHADEARQMGQQGAEYVAARFRWPDVMDRAERLLADCGFA